MNANYSHEVKHQPALKRLQMSNVLLLMELRLKLQSLIPLGSRAEIPSASFILYKEKN